VRTGRNAVLVRAAAILSLCTVGLAGAGSASAMTNSTINGTGTVQCAGISGKITFKPPLHSSGPVNTEVPTATYKVSKCSGGTPSPSLSVKGGTKPFAITGGTNTCSGLFNEDASVSIYVGWAGNALNPSISSIANTQISVAPDGNVYFLGGNSPSQTEGSFPDNTGLTQLSFTFVQTDSQINSKCASKKGLKTLTFNSGPINPNYIT
jgi:hypothetical protein